MSRYPELGLPLIHAGKVRELYDLPAADGVERMLMVATDQVSAFDFVLSPEVPDKGAVLTQMSQWWFAQLTDLVDNHVLSTDVPAAVAGRAVVCEKLEMLPVECVARGYLTGSGLTEYQQTQSVCGVPLPAGLHDGARLPEPIFTPATKAPMGEHDENVDFDTMVAHLDQHGLAGRELGQRLRDLTLSVYARGEQLARQRGIILADTKFEFGRRADGTIVLADEVLTPDSSRFWDADAWDAGQVVSFDKQDLRDWLQHESGWDKASNTPPPALPEHVVAATRARYLEAYRRLVGADFA